ncbi:MAG: hypothetical protein ACLGIJ_09035 [Candidatus Limnocylindria bacterium]
MQRHLPLAHTTGADRSAAARAHLVDALATEERIWGLPARTVGILLAVPLVLHVLAVALAAAAPVAFFALTEEDAVVEWAQVAALLVAVVAGAIVTRRLGAAGLRWQAALAAVATLTVFGVAGEEISWGQRIIGVATPAALEAINVQGETNVHNIGALELGVRLGQIGVAGLLAALPVLALTLARPFARVDRLLVPPLALTLWFLPLAIYWLIRLPLVPDTLITRFSEVPELALYVGLALLALLHVRRLAPAEASPSPVRERSAVG